MERSISLALASERSFFSSTQAQLLCTFKSQRVRANTTSSGSPIEKVLLPLALQDEVTGHALLALSGTTMQSGHCYPNDTAHQHYGIAVHGLKAKVAALAAGHIWELPNALVATMLLSNFEVITSPTFRGQLS